MKKNLSTTKVHWSIRVTRYFPALVIYAVQVLVLFSPKLSYRILKATGVKNQKF